MHACPLSPLSPPQVPRGSPADKAGLQGSYRDPSSGAIVLGDIIVGVDGRPVTTYTDLLDALDTKKVGDTVQVGVPGRAGGWLGGWVGGREGGWLGGWVVGWLGGWVGGWVGMQRHMPPTNERYYY